MATERYTNSRQESTWGASPYIVQTRVHAPYVSRGPYQNLTAKEVLAREQVRVASGLGGGMGGGGYGGGGGGGFGGNTMQSQAGNWFSAQMGPDFLEMPQSIREKRELYRHYYNSDELVGQAIDIHTELPLSKVRLAAPKPRTCPPGFDDPHDYGEFILSKFKRMCDRIKLFQRLITGVHHYWLDGTAVFWAEDLGVEVPNDVGYERVYREAHINEAGEAIEAGDAWVAKPTLEEEEQAYYQKHYEGWSKLLVLPVDRVKITSFDLSDKVRLDLIPSDRARTLIEEAKQGNEQAQQMVDEIPAQLREFIEQNKLIPLGTNPDEGSFGFLLHGRKGADDEIGHSILDRCLRTLTLREKLRQAQTSIASRAMTPKRIVWAEGLSDTDVDALREQVDLALVDPDYSIVTNYEVHWEEMGARDRLLDLSAEYEQTERRLLAGLGVTENLMSGEGLYSGDRIKLEVMNNRYIHLRETIQEFVEQNLFMPVARRMGFIEKDKWGQEVVLYPRLSFTRLPLRDSQDMFDALLNLYQKGSVSIDLLLEHLNIDPEDTKSKIERDMFTSNDAIFNEVLRAIYAEVGRMLPERTNVLDKIAEYLKLKVEPKKEEEGGGRY